MQFAMDDQFQRGVLDHYRRQSGAGGGFPVYRGADLQYGNGFGDIFRSIGRFLLPILAPAATRFISSAAQGLSEGRNLREATRAAVQPTISEAVSATGSQIMSRIPQGGFGRRRRRRGSRKGKKILDLQNGMGRRRRGRKGKRVSRKSRKVYKGVGRKRRRSMKNSFRSRKFSKFVNSNF